MDAISEEPSPNYAVTLSNIDTMPDKTARIAHHHPRIVQQVDTEIGQLHDPMMVIPDACQDVEGFGRTFGVSMIRGVPVAHHGCSSVN
jgi:hypothetical protein